MIDAILTRYLNNIVISPIISGNHILQYMMSFSMQYCTIVAAGVCISHLLITGNNRFVLRARRLFPCNQQILVYSPWHKLHNQNTRYTETMLVYCRVSIADGGPTANQHWFSVW